MRKILIIIVLKFGCLAFVNGIHPECRFHLEIRREEIECLENLKRLEPPDFKGCGGTWDNLTCWKPAEIGDTVTLSCPKVFSYIVSKTGNISKNCTANGWSEIFPDIFSACGFNDNVMPDEKLTFYVVVQALYTLGHSASLIALTTGSAVLCVFRKLHCTRNYIHLNLFFSFILRAVSVLVKDRILYSDNSSCTEEDPSLIGCKTILVIFQYCIMANFFWLLVEGLYLHTLLLVIFSENRHFIVYLLIGWGVPTNCLLLRTLTRIYLEDTGCWDTNDKSFPRWVIRGPILVSILVNCILFISIIRILVQKLRSPDVGGNDQSQYKRLAKSTLLLIPLFGVHYIVFISELTPIEYKIFFELAIGSFQGLVVAILYCFLNSEVQSEVKGKWRLCLHWYVSRDYRLHNSSIARNSSGNVSYFHRNSRAQSFQQTETSVI
ncbi:vasoactive intestinal polypeptide receptor 2-like [Acipenser ruthenus]|uniref:vasoactive intestinal polypeptide receptor 2-like n=1 Tax=Acipenser ruthenus TaxID=7906 RepID=UPI00274150F9|nr:vasoactive intestinal polypeptide receptor 2-like [Acipenser ruthenus]